MFVPRSVGERRERHRRVRLCVDNPLRSPHDRHPAPLHLDVHQGQQLLKLCVCLALLWTKNVNNV